MITGIYPPDIGGPATYVPTVAYGLLERGHRVRVVTLADDPGRSQDKYTFEVIRIPRNLYRPARYLITISKLVRLGYEADLLYVNGLAMEAALSNVMLRKPLVIKVVGDIVWERATSRGWTSDPFDAFQQARHGPQIETLKALRKWWTRQGRAVIVPSHYLAGRVASWGIRRDRIFVIYNGVEPKRKVEPEPLNMTTPVNAAVIGRLVRWKHVDGILESLPSVPGLGLVIVGDGPERRRLEEMTSMLGIADRVHFTGPRPREEALGIMAWCDLFIMNSTYEGLPHTLLEAMSLGRAVVATAAGGNPEVIKNGETGILIPHDRSALVSALKRLVTNADERNAMGQAAKQWIEERFTERRMIDETERLLTRLVSAER